MNPPNRAIRTLALLAILSGTAGTAGAVYHLRLEKSAPARDQPMTGAPAEVRLWFSEKPELRLSTITLVRSDSSEVKLGKVHATDDPKSIAAAVSESLAPGAYLVKWKTASRDGHPIRGSYPFAITK